VVTGEENILTAGQGYLLLGVTSVVALVHAFTTRVPPREISRPGHIVGRNGKYGCYIVGVGGLLAVLRYLVFGK
jgi:hypothetical protein